MITAHCIVKNEEVFVKPAILSVIDFVDHILVFDTGSTDKTVSLIQELIERYPNKIIFEEKGPCDKKRHTELRQEMIDKTTTPWFMILDGDEVWTKRGLDEAVDIINIKPEIECIMAPFYLCVGDVYHRYYKKGKIKMLGREDFFYPRLIKKINGVHWSGDYNEDTLVNEKGEVFFNIQNSAVLSSRYWHMTHLKRSSADDNDYSSGGTRLSKRKLTYFYIGRKISEPIPESLTNQPSLSFGESMKNFIKLLVKKM